MLNFAEYSSTLKWQIILLIILCLAIAVHFLVGLSPVQEGGRIAPKDIPLVAAIIVCGVPLLFQIGNKLYKRDLGADSLAALAVITATVLAEYLAASIVLMMLATGQIFESYALRRASAVLSALAERMPSVAHRRQGTTLQDIEINEIHVGDTIVIYPHEICPVDGIVIEGKGSMDESYLTGEPYFVSKAPGVAVLSGAINGDELLTIEADKIPRDSRYAKIMKVMEESEQKRPHIRRLSDQLGAIFAPFALGFALLAWAISGESVRFLAVLVIATPCPLLIAIPVTIISVISFAARKGIIIKNPVVLEQLPLCKTAIFDKTGTLTYGRATLEEIVPSSGFSKDEILRYAASVEQFSKHPLAEAVLKAAQESGLTRFKVDHVSEKPGEGLVAVVGKSKVKLTSRKFIEQNTPTQVDDLPPQKPGLESVLLINQKVAGVFYFRDTLRRDGFSFISHLKPTHKFKKIIILSGDRLSEVSYLAQQLNVKDVYASQSPEQKVDIVRKETAQAPTFFMGDGINDAPALAAATVGLAFGAHNLVATEAAGAVFMESSLAKVDELIHISTAMRNVALVSAGGGMALSIIGMGFAGLGFITPVVGALLQEGIDILSILYALQLTWRSQFYGDIQEDALAQ